MHDQCGDETPLWDGSSYVQRPRLCFIESRCELTTRAPFCAVVTLADPKRQRLMGLIMHARPLTFGTSDSHRPGSGPVDPTSLATSDSGPGPLADAMVTGPHGCGRDNAARAVQSSVIVNRCGFEALWPWFTPGLHWDAEAGDRGFRTGSRPYAEHTDRRPGISGLRIIRGF